MSEEHEIIQELRDAGVQDSYVERVEKMISASPIRKERDEARQQAEAALAEANRFRGMALAATFKEVGIPGRPDRFNIPADLDITDVDAVRTWAVDGGIVAGPPEATTPEVQAATERIVGASEGAPPPSASSARDEVLAAETQDEFWARAKATGVAQ